MTGTRVDLAAPLAQALLSQTSMPLAYRVPSSVIVVASRRRTPRVAVGDQIGVEIASVLVPAELVDLGFGGFSVETRCSLRVGAVHDFRFSTAPGRTIELSARVVHCHRKATSDWSERYVAGCEFIYDPSLPTEALIDELMDSATGVLSFE